MSVGGRGSTWALVQVEMVTLHLCVPGRLPDPMLEGDCVSVVCGQDKSCLAGPAPMPRSSMSGVGSRLGCSSCCSVTFCQADQLRPGGAPSVLSLLLEPRPALLFSCPCLLLAVRVTILHLASGSTLAVSPCPSILVRRPKKRLSELWSTAWSTASSLLGVLWPLAISSLTFISFFIMVTHMTWNLPPQPSEGCT